MTLREFAGLLNTLPARFDRYKVFKQPPPYGSWWEYGMNTLVGDNHQLEKSYQVQVDYFTETSDDPVVDQLYTLLNANEIPFDYLVDYDRDTSLIHHIFDCEVV